MEINLLKKGYDKHYNLFINDKITLEMFIELENEYIKRYRLFIINLN